MYKNLLPIFKCFCICLYLCYSPFLFAEEQKYLLQAGVHAALSEIQDDISEQKNTRALQKLKKLLNTDKLKDYDAAVIYQTMGFAENGLNNFKAAANNFIQALSYNALPPEVTHQLNYSTAQLLIHLGQYEKGLDYLSKWFTKEPSANSDAHILAASAYYHLNNYQKLIYHTEKAISLSKKPLFNWHELLLMGYVQTKQYSHAASTLEKMIILQPNNVDYWLQLADIYQNLKKEKKALAVYELAYTKGILKKNDILYLVKSYLYHDMPFKAGKLLEHELNSGGIKSDKSRLSLLVDSWLLAHEKEKAESVFIEIINQYNDENARMRLGQLYLESEQWNKAVKVLEVKLTTKNESLKSKIHLLLGIAQYHSNNLSEATSAFTLALTDKATAEQAKWWLDHLKKKTDDISS